MLNIWSSIAYSKESFARLLIELCHDMLMGLATFKLFGIVLPWLDGYK